MARRVGAAAAAIFIPILLGLASTIAIAQHEHDSPPVSTAGASASEPLFNEADLRFLQHMIVHHEQAVVMSLLVPTRTERQQFVRFASYVRRGQAAEIEGMQSLLDLAADRGIVVGEHGLQGDPPMEGMLSSTQMQALEAATLAEFERLWLEGMIYHHQGAIDMARAQQQRQLESGRQPFEISVLVEEILVEQQAEITKMHAWLGEWGLRDP
jgi:uncharacterized protein (DUF305 family)